MSERQTLLRDMNNRLTREDVDILDRFGGFYKEIVHKVIINESESMLGQCRMWIISSMG